MSNTKTNHYVDNESFASALIERQRIIKECEKQGKEPPILSDYLGKCLYEICNRLSYRPNFIGYSYRTEMVGDAIENCLRVVDKFDPEKSMNPFSYFTQIAFYAFLRRIAVEKKQSYIKGKILEELPLDELVDMEDFDGNKVDFIEEMRQRYYYDTSEYESKKEEKKKKKSVLEDFMEVEE